MRDCIHVQINKHDRNGALMFTFAPTLSFCIAFRNIRGGHIPTNERVSWCASCFPKVLPPDAVCHYTPSEAWDEGLHEITTKGFRSKSGRWYSPACAAQLGMSESSAYYSVEDPGRLDTFLPPTSLCYIWNVNYFPVGCDTLALPTTVSCPHGFLLTLSFASVFRSRNQQVTLSARVVEIW